MISHQPLEVSRPKMMVKIAIVNLSSLFNCSCVNRGGWATSLEFRKSPDRRSAINQSIWWDHASITHLSNRDFETKRSNPTPPGRGGRCFFGDFLYTENYSETSRAFPRVLPAESERRLGLVIIPKKYICFMFLYYNFNRPVLLIWIEL